MESNPTPETSKLVSILTAAAMAPVTLGKSTVLLLPPNYSSKDVTAEMEKAEPIPFRKKGTVTLISLGALIQYCKDQAAKDSAYIYADPDATTFTAVFNDQRAGQGWRDHRAVFKAEFTPEFKRWLEHSGEKFSQTEFAEFIEDNFADLQGDDAPLLLKVATTIASTSGINFSSARRLHDGQTQLTYNETINTTAGENGALQIPKTFTLGIRIFKNGEGYKLIARLKYRLQSGLVQFHYELERPERAIEDAFKGYVDKVATDTEYTVLLGKA